MLWSVIVRKYTFGYVSAYPLVSCRHTHTYTHTSVIVSSVQGFDHLLKPIIQRSLRLKRSLQKSNYNIRDMIIFHSIPTELLNKKKNPSSSNPHPFSKLTCFLPWNACITYHCNIKWLIWCIHCCFFGNDMSYTERKGKTTAYVITRGRSDLKAWWVSWSNKRLRKVIDSWCQ